MWKEIVVAKTEWFAFSQYVYHCTFITEVQLDFQLIIILNNINYCYNIPYAISNEDGISTKKTHI